MGRKRKLENALAQALAVGISTGEQRAFERVLRATASDVLGLEVADTLDFVRQAGVEGALPLIKAAAGTTWPERQRERLTPVLSAIMTATTDGKAPVLGSFSLRNPKMSAFLDSYVSEPADTLPATSYENARRVIGEALDEGLSVPDASARLRERLEDLNKNRADLIARTELNRSQNSASLLQARESGVVKGKVWLATNDARTRPEHAALDGVEVGIDEPFPNGLDAPGEPNCRCTVRYTIDTEALRGRVA